MKTLVLYSGGMDSRVLLQQAIFEGDDIVALNMYYGQKHEVEREMARHVIHVLNDNRDRAIEYYELNLADVFKYNLDASALLKGSSQEIKHESYQDQLKEGGMVSAYVPYRNGLFLSVAASIAVQLKCDRVAYGAHSDDATLGTDYVAAYPDCTVAFVSAQKHAIKEGTGGKVTLWAPFLRWTKVGIAKIGVEFGMTQQDFDATWSCYEGKDHTECGVCGTCRDKAAALEAAHMQFTREKFMLGSKISPC